MTKPKSSSPVSSFGPELISALREGANRETRLEFPSPQAAQRFVQRINSLRKAMRLENHPDTDQAYRAGCRIPRENPSWVIIAPKDSEFRDILKAAQVTVGLPEIPPAATPAPGVAPDAADSFLASLGSAPSEIPPPRGEKNVDKKD